MESGRRDHGLPDPLGPNPARQGRPQASRIVNDHSPLAKKGDTYAVVVTLLPKAKDDGTPGEVNVGVKSPKDVQFCRVHHGFIKAYVEKMRQWLTLAARNPAGNEADNLRQTGLPERLWKRGAERLSETTFDKRLDQQLRWMALYEMGHACGLPGHTANPDSVTEIQGGDPTCYMRDSGDNAGMFYIILQSLFKPSALNVNHATRGGRSALKPAGIPCKGPKHWRPC